MRILVASMTAARSAILARRKTGSQTCHRDTEKLATETQRRSGTEKYKGLGMALAKRRPDPIVRPGHVLSDGNPAPAHSCRLSVVGWTAAARTSGRCGAGRAMDGACRAQHARDARVHAHG